MVDTDGDGLSDDEELALGTDPLLCDTDGNGYSDGEEAHGTAGPDGDIDGDGLTNSREDELGTNKRLADTDGDGLSDQFEVEWNPASFGLSAEDASRCPALRCWR